jgi:hypothetical protein
MIEESPNLEERMENKNDRMMAYDYPIMTDDVTSGKRRNTKGMLGNYM